MQSKNGKKLKDIFISGLESSILSGELRPGDRLRPERELALQYGISRSSVNQGILDLERMGFLRIVPRKGTFVAEYKKKATPSTMAALMQYDSTLVDSSLFRDLMDMRILIERECVRLACGKAGTDDLLELEQINEQIHTSSGENLTEAIYSYHLCLVQMSENAAYTMIFQSFEKMLKNMIVAHYSGTDEIRKTQPDYDGLTSAVALRDAENADRMIVKLLGSASEYLNGMLKGRIKHEC